MSRLRLLSAAAAGAALLTGSRRTPAPSGETPPRQVEGTAVTLPAPSTTPRYAINIADPDEVPM